MDNNLFNLLNFRYDIPKELIAQEARKKRAESRLLIVNRKDKTLKEVIFKEIVNFLEEGDILVLNNTKVIKARLVGRKGSGSKIEILLLKEKEEGIWEALAKPGKRAKIGQIIVFSKEDNFYAKIIDRTPQGGRILRFYPPNIKPLLKIYGKVPLPPYIKREIKRDQEYQTVFAKKEGAVAAPTAGFHFNLSLLEAIREKGIKPVYITLHCGLSTFRPVKTPDIRNHTMEEESFQIPPKTSKVINQAKQRGRRIFAVGTTVVRALESSVSVNEGEVRLFPQVGKTHLYIYPGYDFKIVDAIVTNFHTPSSTNLILIASFCGLDLIKKAYEYAIKSRFRFFTFGDAMLVI
jgi:S-adenosylmethionine:tRNA ribosyltransferase-isomerase